MKKLFITFILLCSMGNIMAQNYTQAFDSVFSYIGETDANISSLYEMTLPNGILTKYPSSTTGFQTNNKDTSETFDNTHSIGGDIGWFEGVSLRINLINNFYLQADLGLGLFLNFCALPISPDIVCDFGGQLHFLYERKFPKRTNTYWIVGGGLCFAAVSPDGKTKKVNTMKGGGKALIGIEYYFGGKPVSMQVDARLGYNVMYSPKDSYRGVLIPDINPYHYFDYGFVFSLRYHFGKKN